MKQFYSFLDAIKYHACCPLCKNRLEINDRDLAMDYDQRSGGQRLAFNLTPGTDDVLYINPVTEAVELVLTEKYQLPALNVNGTISNIYTPAVQMPILDGRFIHGLTIDCKSCCQFSYTLQIHIDLNVHKHNAILVGTYLNSETVSVEDNEMVHEIKNIYSTDVTEYSYFSKNGDDKKSTLPLIPLDLINPKETVSRIRKLLIFT